MGKKKKGIDEAWELIGKYHKTLSDSGELTERRAEQAKSWMWAETAANLLSALREDQGLEQRIPELERAVMEGRLPATLAAAELLKVFLSQKS